MPLLGIAGVLVPASAGGVGVRCTRIHLFFTGHCFFSVMKKAGKEELQGNYFCTFFRLSVALGTGAKTITNVQEFYILILICRKLVFTGAGAGRRCR